MAIDYFCHTKYAKKEVEKILNNLSLKHKDIFSHKFLISSVSEHISDEELIAKFEIDDIKKYHNDDISDEEMDAIYKTEGEEIYSKILGKNMPLEFGFYNAQSKFLIRVNDKNALDRSDEVIAIIKEAFGKDNVLVLFDGETLY